MEKSFLESAKGNKPKCHFCQVCDGKGCIGEMPGMGGVFQNANFIANCADWHKYTKTSNSLPKIRLAPITGAVENVGWVDEKSFYETLLTAVSKAGVDLSIGDGTPDEKLLYGIEALKKLKKKAAVFIKPYPQDIFFERLTWAEDVAEVLGIDIDSYNIVTMRNLVNLEKKSSTQLLEIKQRAKCPFALKGVFTKADLETVASVKPDIVVISNHGGRVETNRKSTADFLAENYCFLKKHCGEIWVDGGLRTSADLKVAKALGAKTVLLGRPFLTALLRDGEMGVFNLVKSFL